MTANKRAVSDPDAAAKNILTNLAKLRWTKISCLEEVTNGIPEEIHPEIKPTAEPNTAFRRKIAWKMTLKILLGHIMAACALRPLLFEVSWACVIYCKYHPKYL